MRRSLPPPDHREGPATPGARFPPFIEGEDEGGDRVSIGRIEAPHGTHGEIRLAPDTDFPERFQAMSEIRMRDREGRERIFQIERVRARKNQLVLKLGGCDTRGDAELLRGLRAVVPERELAVLPEDTFYVHQIVGMEVITTEGETLGRVDHVLQTGSNDVYVTPRALIPALQDIVLDVDLAERRITVRLVEGLLK